MLAGIDNFPDLPAAESDPRTWTAEERRTVMFNRRDWIQKCLDYNEQERQIQQLLKFLQGQANG
jgi:hypothetical protein